MTAMWDWLEKSRELSEAGTPFALVTVTRCQGSCPASPGAKMIVLGDESLFGTVGGGRLEQLATADCLLSLDAGEAKSVRYTLGASAGQCCGGVVEAFIEPFNIGPELYLFGAGHVGQALCRTLIETPFIVHAIDEREGWLSSLPPGVRRHADGWEAFTASARWSARRTFVAIMTHRHDLDEAVVADVVHRPSRHIGLIGSDTKWRRFRDRLLARGFAENDLDRVHCPIGIPIGGKSPAEVAISIAADLLRIHHGVIA